MKQIYQRIGQRYLLLVHRLQHISTHHDRVMVKQRNQNINASCSHSRIWVLHSKGDNCKQAVTDKVCKQVCAGWSLEVFRNCRALVKELDCILFLLVVCVFWVKHCEEFI